MRKSVEVGADKLYAAEAKPHSCRCRWYVHAVDNAIAPNIWPPRPTSLLFRAMRAGDGTIDKEEWKDLLAAAGAEGLSADMQARLFAQADKDGDGQLDFNEIKALGDQRKKDKPLG